MRRSVCTMVFFVLLTACICVAGCVSQDGTGGNVRILQPQAINAPAVDAGNYTIVGDWVLERGFSDFSIYLIICDDGFFGIKYLYGFPVNSSDATIMPGDSTYYYGNLTMIDDNKYNLTADYEEWRGKNNTLIYANNEQMNMGIVEYDKSADKIAYIIDRECLMLKRLD